jgi:rubrerythrin
MLVAALVLIGLFIARPFFDRQRGHRVSALAGHERSALLAERDRVLMALQELDFDNALDKIPAEDYPQQRARLLQHGANILRQIDALTPHTAAAAGDAESRIEAVVAVRRADAAQTDTTAAPEPVSREEDIESLIAARRSERKEKSGGFCPKCGKPVLRSDRFCPNCGKAIK